MKRRTGQLGFTLVELLLASAIMAVILGALGNLFAGTTRAYRVNEEATNLQQTADAAGQLLMYEVGLAGYRGSDNNISTRTFTTPVLLGLVSVPASTLKIETGASTSVPDKVFVSYYEDRNYSSSTTYNPTKLGTEFSVDTSAHSLNRYASNDPEKRAVIQDVYNLKVLRYVRKNGRECNTVTPSTATTPADLAALRLELTFTDGLKEQVVIALPNPQTSTSSHLPTLTVLANPSGC